MNINGTGELSPWVEVRTSDTEFDGKLIKLNILHDIAVNVGFANFHMVSL